MYTINIHHKGDEESTSYRIYKKVEADKQDIDYLYWKEANAGDYAISDD